MLHWGNWLASRPVHLVFTPEKWYQLSGWLCRYEENVFSLSGFEPQVLARPAHNPVTVPSETWRLFISKSHFSKYWVEEKSLETEYMWIAVYSSLTVFSVPSVFLLHWHISTSFRTPVPTANLLSNVQCHVTFASSCISVCTVPDSFPLTGHISC